MKKGLLHILGMFVFLVIWILGCYLNDAFFKIDSMSYIMAYGFGVGMVGHIFHQAIIR